MLHVHSILLFMTDSQCSAGVQNIKTEKRHQTVVSTSIKLPVKILGQIFKNYVMKSDK